MKFRNADQQYLYDKLHAFVDKAKGELQLGGLALLMAFEGYKVPYLVKRQGIKSGQQSKPKETEKSEESERLEALTEFEQGA
jgi:hypothetical protein